MRGFLSEYARATFYKFKGDPTVLEVDIHEGCGGIGFLSPFVASRAVDKLVKSPKFSQLVRGMVFNNYRFLVLRMNGCVMIWDRGRRGRKPPLGLEEAQSPGFGIVRVFPHMNPG